MTKTQVEVITSVQRRRSWSRAEKERIVAAAMEPGAVASEVARAAGMHTSQLFRWRQQLCERTQVPAAFNPVAITPEPEAASAPPVAARAGVIGTSCFRRLSQATFSKPSPRFHGSFALLFSPLFSGHASNPERSHKRGLKKWDGIKQSLLI